MLAGVFCLLVFSSHAKKYISGLSLLFLASFSKPLEFPLTKPALIAMRCVLICCRGFLTHPLDFPTSEIPME